MDRTNFFTIVTATATTSDADKMKELDYLHNPLTKFKMNYLPSKYRVIAADLMRPDRISDKNYNTPEFWWIICLVNNIDSPLVDLEVGQILDIPSELDIFEFQRRYRVRRT